MSLQTSKSSIAFHWNLQNRFIVRLFRNFGLFRRYHSFKKKKSVNSFKKWSPYRLNNVHRNTSWSTKFNVGDGITSCFFHPNKQRHFFFLLMFISFVLSWLEENQRSCHCVCFLELISYYYLASFGFITRFFYKNVENFWSLWMFLTFWILSLKTFLTCSYFWHFFEYLALISWEIVCFQVCQALECS